MKVRLNRRALVRQPELRAALEAVGQWSGDVLEVERADYLAHANAGAAAPVKPGDWPVWAKEFAAQRMTGERGIGDTVERLVGLFGTPAFTDWHRARFGSQPCPACPARWNSLYPYVSPPLSPPEAPLFVP